MFFPATLSNYAESLAESEKGLILSALPTLRREVRGEVEVIMSEDLVEAGLGTYVSKLNRDGLWIFHTPVQELQKLQELRVTENLKQAAVTSQ